MKQGFTLLEVLFAILLITLGIGGVFALVWQVTTFTSAPASQLTAAYLAQEGIEIVRNIRDGNWLQARVAAVPWDEGLAEGEWEGDYTMLQDLAPWSGDGRYLNIDSNAFYSYSQGLATYFKRKITIAKGIDEGGREFLSVIVEVDWQQRGNPQNFIAQENLYNWH